MAIVVDAMVVAIVVFGVVDAMVMAIVVRGAVAYLSFDMDHFGTVCSRVKKELLLLEGLLATLEKHG